MIGYVTVGTNNLEKAAEYYDALMGSAGMGRLMEQKDYFIVWGESMEATSLGVTHPFNMETATPGNGNMVAMAFQTPEQVQAFHAKALALGGSNEGDPGFRPEGNSSGFYAGYFRDPEGNKFNAFCMVE
jgi:predicted lactoylglutathione lyase